MNLVKFQNMRSTVVLKKSKYVVLCYLFMHFSVFAEVGNTTISVDMGSDEQNNNNSLLTIDMTLQNSKHLFFGAGKSKSSSNPQPIENNLAFLGMSQKYNNNWKLTGMFDYSGLKDAFTMFSTSAAIKYNQKHYYMELIPAYRRINLTTLSQRKILITSTALGVKSGIYIGDHFRLSGSAYSYDYSNDVSKLASFASTRYFNVKTLLLSSGLLKKSYNAETGLDFDSFSISIGKNRSVSAIDYTSSDYVYSVLDYYISDAWGVSFLYGEYLDTPKDENNFSSFTVNYNF